MVSSVVALELAKRTDINNKMCTSTENLFWWIKEVEIFTSVAIVQFNVNDKPVNNFQKPFTLTFETHADIASVIDIHRSATPKILDNNTLKTDHDFERMSMHRIDVFKKQPFIIKFIDLPAAVILDILGEPIFFLSDIPISCRYGYVLIVKTGNKSKAGTTSNVSIKIYGTKSESNAHVLNYPDPEKKLLQKNEDNWFFVATEFYLGDIEKIELWCDFIGYNPAWFCSELEIFDIQQNKYWSFQVNTWFEVLKNEQMMYTAYPTKPGDVKKKKVAALNLFNKFFNSFRGAHMWNLIKFLLITNIIISMTILIILGFWVPHMTGLLWLTSVAISLLVYIFIMENLMRVIVNFTTNQKTREQRHWAEIKERLWEIVQDLFMITIYVLLLYLVIMMDRDATSYISHIEVEDLIKGTHSRTILLDDVYHRNEIENYIEETLITSMHSLQWYGKYVSKNPGTTIDKTNKYLGIARLRQHRASSLHCDEDFINQTSCYPTYYGYPEYRNFSENWLEVELSNQFSRMDHIWKYVSESVAGTVNYFGTFAVYPGGGYIATLGRTLQNSLLNFNYLRRNTWIDSLSRCIFIEFLLYNPCNNLFNSIRITFEIYATGYTENNLEIQTARLLFVKEETSDMVWIILFSFIIMLIILIIKLTHRIIRKRKLLLKDIWHVADIFIILISLTCLGLYIARSDVVRIFLSDVESAKNNEFVNYFHLMYTESSLTIVAAILVFLATLRLWKLMRFMTIVKVVEKTLILSAPALLSLFLCQLVFMFACAFFAITKYGDYDYDFRGVIASLTTLFVGSLNFYNFDFDAISGSVGYLFYSGFMLVTLGIYTIDIAIITISYGEAQFFYSSEEEYNIVDLLKERCQYYGEVIRVKWRKLRLRGGNEKGKSDEKVYPKDDEFRYANCVTLQSNKMDAMTCVTKCLLRNMRKERKIEITDKDADLIKHTIVNLFRTDTEEKEIFFTSNVQGEKFKFVDDKVMLKMQGVVEALLSQDDDRSERMKRRQLYKKIIESHKQKMDDIADNLNVLSNVLKAVNIRK
ncbi:polycystic kidney disease protein 1-like 2 [Anoplophora glabripennis]|uniref:polycystic kidney disease protein 1-like 2 n=1 Tax=Anoplophora glabripennis TaxID=217634 RepID=UPI000C78DE12|nr:polycystic kidney disease protein 1-like 2 [Anoplophora glabripennis]